MGQYDYHKREHNNSWIMFHCEVLLEEAIKHNNSSLVIYSALEARTLLEKTEYDILRASTGRENWEEIENTAKMKNGIDQINKKFNGLKYRYQTFSEALLRSISNLGLKAYDYRQSGFLQSQLSQYLHTYTKEQNEMDFNSQFIQEGIEVVKKTLVFAKSYYVKKSGGALQMGLIDYSTLPAPARVEFEAWLKSLDTDTEALYLRLKAINDREYDGKTYEF